MLYAIVNGIFKKISDSSVLVYRKATDFCINFVSYDLIEFIY